MSEINNIGYTSSSLPLLPATILLLVDISALMPRVVKVPMFSVLCITKTTWVKNWKWNNLMHRILIVIIYELLLFSDVIKKKKFNSQVQCIDQNITSTVHNTPTLPFWNSEWEWGIKRLLKTRVLTWCHVFLTFRGPCIANIFAEYNQQDATFHNFFISVRCSTCLGRFFCPSSGAQNCTYSIRYLSDQYCYLLLAWSGLWQVAVLVWQISDTVCAVLSSW